MRSRLFLICPTDNIEVSILKKFKGHGFFFSGLGNYYEFDFQEQWNILNLLEENRIERISFVSSIYNTCYQAYSEGIGVNNTLINNESFLMSLNQGCIYSTYSIHPLVYYLNQQIDRLISTDYLGLQLEEKSITVDAYLYDIKLNCFYGFQGMKNKSFVFTQLSYN